MEHVNYEERYPTVVDAHNTPQDYPQVVNEDFPKYSMIAQNDKNGSVAVADSYPEVHHEYIDEDKAGTKRYCGMSKKAFLLVLIPAILLVTGAIGGAVGGVMAGKNKKETSSVSDSSSSNSTASSTSTTTSTATSSTASTTATSLATTLDTSESIGALGASMFQDVDDQVYFHLYQIQGSNIGYRVYNGVGAFNTPKSLDFTIAPKTDTPLAAVETSSSGTSYMSLFYLDDSNNIILANYSSILGGATLNLTKTVQIVASSNVHNSSQLAAIYLGETYGYRMYYQKTSGVLQEMVGTNDIWNAGVTLSEATASGGSPLSISSVQTPQMNLFYVDSTTNNLFNIPYKGGWQSPSALSNATTINAWDGTDTALAAVAQTNSTWLRTYYIGSNHKVYEMTDEGAETTTWTNNSNHDTAWPSADSTAAGGLVGIAWEDSIRLYYVSNSTVEQLGLDMTGGIAGRWFEQTY